jgi:hypothetical protein
MEIIIFCVVAFVIYMFWPKNNKLTVTTEVTRYLNSATKKLSFSDFEGSTLTFANKYVSIFWGAMEPYLKQQGIKMSPAFLAMMILKGTAERLHEEEQARKTHNPNMEFVLMALSIAVMECHARSSATGNPMELSFCAVAMEAMQRLSDARHIQGMELLQ